MSLTIPTTTQNNTTNINVVISSAPSALSSPSSSLMSPVPSPAPPSSSTSSSVAAPASSTPAATPTSPSPTKAKAIKPKSAAPPPPPPPPPAPVLIFKATRGKKLFKIFDNDHDGFLSPAEFKVGLKTFVNAPELTISDAQIDALWIETDLNADGKISWAEFAHRFCGAPNPLLKSLVKRPTMQLQVIRKKESSRGGDVRTVLEHVYDGSKLRYKGVDVSKLKQVNPASFKKLLLSVLVAEKEEAKKVKREVEEWARPFQTGINQKDIDKLYASFDEKKQGKIDLTAYFEVLKTRPAADVKKSKKKSKKVDPSQPQAYILVSVKPEHIRDFVSEQILKQLDDDYKCHPVLKHWGDDLKLRRGLNTSGYKEKIFLSERTKIKAIVKLEQEIRIYAACRTEYTAMARFESLYHVCLHLALDESVQRVDVAEKKCWIDGEIDRFNADVLEDWNIYVGTMEDEFEELSIPPIA